MVFRFLRLVFFWFVDCAFTFVASDCCLCLLVAFVLLFWLLRFVFSVCAALLLLFSFTMYKLCWLYVMCVVGWVCVS